MTKFFKKGETYKGKDPRLHYVVDIEANGITCPCGFNCTVEEALVYFSKSRYRGRFRSTFRSGYANECKKCVGKRSKRNYLKRRLEENPDWKPQVIAFYDETDAECTTCRKIQPHADFTKASNKKGVRPVSAACKACISDILFEKRRKDIKKTTYRRYKNSMKAEGNDCDMTYEEFKREVWPWDNRCPILGHKLKFFPREERGNWTGGRHYPYTPCVDHIDPREDLSKNNIQVISWRANELKGDAIPEEIHLLSIYMKDIFSMGPEIYEDFSHKERLRETGWVGKYPDKL